MAGLVIDRYGLVAARGARTMQRLAAAFLTALLASATGSNARPSTTTMTCGQAAATVAKAGAIVLTTGSNTYERFVATSAKCLQGELAETATAPTTDSESCPVGYVCRQRQQYEPSAK